MTLIPPKCLNRQDLPYITGRPALGPILPNPKMAVPSVIMAQRSFFEVYFYANSGF